MITNKISWSLGATPNKNLDPFGVFICSHSRSDRSAYLILHWRDDAPRVLLLSQFTPDCTLAIHDLGTAHCHPPRFNGFLNGLLVLRELCVIPACAAIFAIFNLLFAILPMNWIPVRALSDLCVNPGPCALGVLILLCIISVFRLYPSTSNPFHCRALQLFLIKILTLARP